MPLKWDGLRDDAHCTVVIHRIDGGYAWRKDGDDLVALLREGIADTRSQYPAAR